MIITLQSHNRKSFASWKDVNCNSVIYYRDGIIASKQSSIPMSCAIKMLQFSCCGLRAGIIQDPRLRMRLTFSPLSGFTRIPFACPIQYEIMPV
jgi:hypothetical protein